jgi:hypothetical protein
LPLDGFIRTLGQYQLNKNLIARFLNHLNLRRKITCREELCSLMGSLNMVNVRILNIFVLCWLLSAQIHTSRMTMADDVNLEEFVMTKDEFSGADIKAICTEAGLLALRERRMKVNFLFVFCNLQTEASV